MSFTEFRKMIDKDSIRLHNIRFWQNDRNIWSLSYVNDSPKPISDDSDRNNYETHFNRYIEAITCMQLELDGVNYLRHHNGKDSNKRYCFLSSSGHACVIYPQINAVVACTADDENECRKILNIVEEIVIPDLTANPRDNTMLNALDALYDEYYSSLSDESNSKNTMNS